MKVDSVKSEFLKRLESHTLESLSPRTGISLMLNFYREEQVEGCHLETDSDMLLYQWGTYDWGGGESFELDITRQVILGEGQDEDIFQLSLTFKFQPTESLRQLDEGNYWCHSLEELKEFQAFISSSPAFLISERVEPFEVQLEFGNAG